jgi:hypothetical protein
VVTKNTWELPSAEVGSGVGNDPPATGVSSGLSDLLGDSERVTRRIHDLELESEF